jgi:CDGSH-type Zn-finger protein
MYHPNSPYGKLQTLIESKICLCGNNKQHGKPFCWEHFRAMMDGDLDIEIKNIIRYNSTRSREYMDSVLEVIDYLGLKL